MPETPLHVHRLFDSIRRFLKQFESSREEHVDQNRHTVKSSWELTIRAEEDELDGGWIAMCEQMPGTWSQGETEDEAIENLLEAVAGVLQVMALDAAPETEIVDDRKYSTRHLVAS